MPLPRATTDLYRANQGRVAALVAQVEREWTKAGRVSPRLIAAVLAAQLGAATDGVQSVPAAFRELGYDAKPMARVSPEGFVGTTADGRDMASLVRYADQVADQGGERAARNWLRVAVHSELVDVVRAASSVAIASTPGAGWVRMVNPPCCQDCAILAGRFYRWSQGFQRHKLCDCIHRPSYQSEPRASYATSVPVSQIKDLTQSQRRALDEGADLHRVVNAYRGEVPGRRHRMQTTGELGSVAGMRRLTPEGIYRIAGGSREVAVKLLRANGYLL